MKLKDPYALFEELGIELEWDCGEINGQRIRYLPDMGVLQVEDGDFDKWGNSVGFEFEVWLAKGQRQFLRWYEEEL